jgi:hypothetical protein
MLEDIALGDELELILGADDWGTFEDEVLHFFHRYKNRGHFGECELFVLHEVADEGIVSGIGTPDFQQPGANRDFAVAAAAVPFTARGVHRGFSE